MRRSELLQGIREMMFVSVQKRNKGGAISQAEAAQLLGVSDRTFRQRSSRFSDEGAAGLTDRRRGNAAHNRAPERRPQPGMMEHQSLPSDLIRGMLRGMNGWQGHPPATSLSR